MWIVRLALRRPYSFTVMAILIVLVGVVTITNVHGHFPTGKISTSAAISAIESKYSMA
jgi:hypothetical protein